MSTNYLPNIPLVKVDIKTETVIAAERSDFPEHPESIRPRVFYSVVQHDGDDNVFYVRHYEMLSTGYVIPWKSLPEGRFDFLHFTVKNQKGVRLSLADRPVDAVWVGTNIPISKEVGTSIPTLELRGA